MTKAPLLFTDYSYIGVVLSFCQNWQKPAKAVAEHFWQFCHIVRIPLENNPKTPENSKRKGWVRKSMTKGIYNIYIYRYMCFYLLYYKALQGADSFVRVLSEILTKV